MAGTSTNVPIVAHGTNQPAFEGGTAIKFEGDVGPISNLVPFSIRNGDLTVARSLLVKATLAPKWHWCPIPGLPSNKALEHVLVFIKIAYTQLHPGSLNNEEIAQARKMAILIGVSRAVVTALYNITDSDLIPGERADPMIKAIVAADGTVSFMVKATLDEDKKLLLSQEFVITDEERAVIATTHMSAIGIPPVQGYSLFMTQHHYLSDPRSQSRKAFEVIERANWEASVVKQWWETNTDLLRDALWHKACHPLVLSLKMSLAQSTDVKEMLITAGAGPAAARLPALESEVRAASSYYTLLKTVRGMYEHMGGAVMLTPLEEALAVVENFPMGGVGMVPVESTTIPAYVVDRKSAIAHLRRVCEGNSDVVAHAYGFYSLMQEQSSMMSTTNRQDTLIDAYSLRKLGNTSPASYLEGKRFYEDYKAKKAQERQRGEFTAKDLYMHVVGAGGIERLQFTKPPQ